MDVIPFTKDGRRPGKKAKDDREFIELHHDTVTYVYSRSDSSFVLAE